MKIDPITLHRVVDRGRELGAQYVEARFQDDYRVSVSTRNDKVLAVTSSRSSGVGIRVLVNGSLGFASTNSTTLSDILEVVELAVSQAKATSKLRKKPIEFSDEKLGDGKYSVDEKRSLLGLNVEEMIKLAMEIYRAAKSSVKEAKLPFFVTDIRLHIQEKLVVTS
ncbi:MAG: TldD/PmbA family protein, partial [Desulfurococcaceae archaeon]|nr:TldD/PmbA family protein [Desulfurococcaceae archaeon]